MASRTIAIILGASTYPHAPKLAQGSAFYLSASGIKEYLTNAEGLVVDPNNILWLFDDSHGPYEQLQDTIRFLDTALGRDRNSGPENLILYYVGHGLFTRHDHHYCLAIRATSAANDASSIRARDLSAVLKEHAAFVRRFLIIDCCFSANIYKELQSGPLTAATEELLHEMPTRGTAVLCSSSVESVSLAPAGRQRTMFTHALLETLEEGHPGLGDPLSIEQVGRLVRARLRQDYPSDWVRPEVHSPDQAEGDVADIPLFPNVAKRRTAAADGSAANRSIEPTGEEPSDVSQPRGKPKSTSQSEPRRGGSAAQEPTISNEISRSVGSEACTKNRRLPAVLQALALLLLIAAISWLAFRFISKARVTDSSPQPTDAAALEHFRKSIDGYIELTARERHEAVAAFDQGRRTPQDIETAHGRLSDALRTTLRPDAIRGDVLSDDIAEIIRRRTQTKFASGSQDVLADAVADASVNAQTESSISINRSFNAVPAPVGLRDVLPEIPKELTYVLVGRTLAIIDVDANVVVDYLPKAIPSAVGEEVAPLALPTLAGATTFGIIGDSGTGDDPQNLVSRAMVEYFTDTRRFEFVLMLGNNLYTFDFHREFLDPYAALLERGVRFYAVLGNFDPDKEVELKQLNMKGHRFYAFNEGNARFVALNSNYFDGEQAAWLDRVFTDGTKKWRIAFLHDDLYSPDSKGYESPLKVILEPAFVRNHVNVVFSAKTKAYQRYESKNGITYFVSGGGGRVLTRIRETKQSDFLTLSEHHFIVAEIADDRLFFQMISKDQRLLDCGVLYRTPEARTHPDAETHAWVASCDAARERALTARGITAN